MIATQFRIQGHTIPLKGRTYDSVIRAYVNGSGTTRCSCGVESPVLPSTNARQEWARKHKEEIVASGGAEIRPVELPLPAWRPTSKEVMKRCPASGRIASEAEDPGFDKTCMHVSCPECRRTMYVREGTFTYPAHYTRQAPTRDDEIAKTRLKPIPGLYVLGLGSSNHRQGKHQVWKLTHRDRAYLIWRIGEDYMWTISSYNPFQETYLAITDDLDKTRGIVVDWGEGGSIYDNPKYWE